MATLSHIRTPLPFSVVSLPLIGLLSGINQCTSEDADQDDWTVEQGDCNDEDPSVHPYAGDHHSDGVDTDCDELDCEAGTLSRAYFVVCLTDTTWEGGQEACRMAGYPDLASVDSGDEDAFIFELLTAAGGASTDAPWIGYTDAASEGTWVWSNGSTSSYTNWSSGEPNGGAGENCAHANWPPEGQSWNDAGCGSADTWTGFVCRD